MRRIATHILPLILASMLASSLAFGQGQLPGNAEDSLITTPLPDGDRTANRLLQGHSALQSYFTQLSQITGNGDTEDTDTHNLSIRIESLGESISQLHTVCNGMGENTIPAVDTSACGVSFNNLESEVIDLTVLVMNRLQAIQRADPGPPPTSVWEQVSPDEPEGTPVILAPPPGQSLGNDRATVQAAVDHQLGDLPPAIQRAVVEAAVGDEPPPATDNPVLELVLDLADDYSIPALDDATTGAEVKQRIEATTAAIRDTSARIEAATATAQPQTPPSSRDAIIALMERAEQMGADPEQAVVAFAAAEGWGGSLPDTNLIEEQVQPTQTKHVSNSWVLAMQSPLLLPYTRDPLVAKALYQTNLEVLTSRYGLYTLACPSDETPPLLVKMNGDTFDPLECTGLLDSITYQVTSLDIYLDDNREHTAAIASERRAEPSSPVIVTTTVPLPELQMAISAVQPPPVAVQTAPTVEDFADSCADNANLYDHTYKEAETAHRQILTLTGSGPVVSKSARRTLEKYGTDELEEAIVAFEELVEYHRAHRTKRMVTFAQLNLGADAHKREDCLRLAAFYQSRTAEATAFDEATLRVLTASHVAALDAKGDTVAQATVDHLMAVSGQEGNPFYDSMVATAH